MDRPEQPSGNLAPAPAPVPAPVVKRSAVEGIKEASRQLRGSLGEELRQDTDHFTDPAKQLLKFHGSYQQEDRDARKLRSHAGIGKHYMFMVRCKIPGGKLTAEQYLAMDRIAGQYANGTIRFTTRQSIQLHGILKADLHATIAGINSSLLSTLGACGDVNRNVMACPAPHAHDAVHRALQDAADQLAAHLAPRSTAYHDLWLNGQPVANGAVVEVDEPIYGKVYLPRKFKIGLALPEDNCIDVHAQDLGFLAIHAKGQLLGFNVLVGGGMGMTHGNTKTFPHLGQAVAFVPLADTVRVAEAVVRLYRDHGNRADRKRARIKYVIHDWGVDRFRAVLADYFGGPLESPRPAPITGFDTHLGWHPQGDGTWSYGLGIENGRVKDADGFQLRTALRLLVEQLRPALRITALQDLLLCDLPSSALATIERVLADHGVVRSEQLSPLRQHSMACPAVPTCGLALSEAERVLPNLLDQLEGELRRLGLAEEKVSVRMTGCPNGCARPYQSDIGIVGRSGERYLLFIGGSPLGDRLNFPLRDLVPIGDIVPTLVPVLEHYRLNRQMGEGLGDFCRRLGPDPVQALLPVLAGKA